MKVRALVLMVLGLGPVACMAQSSQFVSVKHYTRAELRPQIQNAHTPQQYEALAGYFRQQQKSLQAKAAEEKVLWDARAQNVVASSNKYPRPVDSAHYLYEYYADGADRNGKLADHYQQLALTETTASNR